MTSETLENSKSISSDSLNLNDYPKQEIQVYYQLFDKTKDALIPIDAILLNYDEFNNWPRYAQAILEDLELENIFDEEIYSAIESGNILFKVYFSHRDNIPEEATWLKNVGVIEYKGLFELEQPLQKALQSSITWVKKWLPGSFKKFLNNSTEKTSAWFNEIIHYIQPMISAKSPIEINYMDKAYWIAYFAQEIEILKTQIPTDFIPGQVATRLFDLQSVISKHTLSPSIYEDGLQELAIYLSMQQLFSSDYKANVEKILLNFRQSLSEQPAMAKECFEGDINYFLASYLSLQPDFNQLINIINYYKSYVNILSYQEILIRLFSSLHNLIQKEMLPTSQQDYQNFLLQLNSSLKNIKLDVLNSIRKVDSNAKERALSTLETDLIKNQHVINVVNTIPLTAQSYFNTALYFIVNVSSFIKTNPVKALMLLLAAQVTAATALEGLNTAKETISAGNNDTSTAIAADTPQNIIQTNTLIDLPNSTPTINQTFPTVIALEKKDTAISAVEEITATNLNIASTDDDMTVTSTQHYPTVINSNQTIVYKDSWYLLDPILISFGNKNITVILQMSNPEAGRLLAEHIGTVSSTYNAETGIWSVSGKPADINLLLARIVFEPTKQYKNNKADFHILLRIIDVETDEEIFSDNIQVKPVSPKLQIYLEDKEAYIGETFRYAFATEQVANSGNSIVRYEATTDDNGPLPHWLEFNSIRGEFKGKPTKEDKGIAIKVTAVDASHNELASKIFNIAIKPSLIISNYEKEMRYSKGDEIVDFSRPPITIASPNKELVTVVLRLSDPKAGHLDIEQELKNSLNNFLYDPMRGKILIEGNLEAINQSLDTLIFIPSSEFNGKCNVSLEVDDRLNVRFQHNNSITIFRKNKKPTFNKDKILAVPKVVNINIGEKYTISLPTDIFIDEDKDLLIYEVISPKWLQLNVKSGFLLEGIPPKTAKGTSKVLISAKDDAGEETIGELFSVEVKPSLIVNIFKDKIEYSDTDAVKPFENIDIQSPQTKNIKVTLFLSEEAGELIGNGIKPVGDGILEIEGELSIVVNEILKNIVLKPAKNPPNNSILTIKVKDGINDIVAQEIALKYLKPTLAEKPPTELNETEVSRPNSDKGHIDKSLSAEKMLEQKPSSIADGSAKYKMAFWGVGTVAAALTGLFAYKNRFSFFKQNQQEQPGDEENLERLFADIPHEKKEPQKLKKLRIE